MKNFLKNLVQVGTRYVIYDKTGTREVTEDEMKETFLVKLQFIKRNLIFKKQEEAK